MGAGKVVNVHVITQAGAIRGRVICTENLEWWATTQRGGNRERDQVGFGRMVLTDGTVRRSPGGVEVTESGEAQATRGRELAQALLDREFRGAVRIDRVLRQILRHRHLLRNAVGRAGAREDEFLDTLSEHRLQQAFGPHDIVLVVAGGLLDGFTDIRERREIDDHFGGGLAQGGADRGLIAHV